METFWNDRYGADAYAYGITPNAYFKQVLDAHPPGSILLPGDGEGRNAVYAARQGWQVRAFDLSEAGQQKARQLATQQGVSIRFDVLNVRDYQSDGSQYDMIGLFYLHLPSALRSPFHRAVSRALKPGGLLVLEAFTPAQIDNRRPSGGPKDLDMVYDCTLLTNDFAPLEIISCEESTIQLTEGTYHQGPGDVVRFIARNTT